MCYAIDSPCIEATLYDWPSPGASPTYLFLKGHFFIFHHIVNIFHIQVDKTEEAFSLQGKPHNGVLLKTLKPHNVQIIYLCYIGCYKSVASYLMFLSSSCYTMAQNRLIVAAQWWMSKLDL
jgi:hypothetical protein